MAASSNIFTAKHSLQKLVTVTLAGCGLLAALDLMWIWHRRTISISFSTTRIMGPLLADGSIDYREAIDHHAAVGVNPANNAAIDLVRSLGPGTLGAGMTGLNAINRIGMKMLPARGHYFVPFRSCYLKMHPEDGHFAGHVRPHGKLSRHPFSSAAHRTTTEWLRLNRISLHWARMAAEKSRFYIPLPRRSLSWYALPDAPLPYLHKLQELQEALLQQGMLRLDRGDVTGCSKDLLAAHRLADLVGQGPTIPQRISARNMDIRASEADWTLLRSTRMTAAEAAAFSASMAALPRLRPLSGAVDHFARWAELDYVQATADDWWGNSVGLHEAGYPIRISALLPPNYTVRMLRINRWYDRFTKIFSIHGALARRDAMAALEIRLSGAESGISASRQRLYLSLVGENLNSLVPLSAREKSARRITRTLLALRQYTADHGHYPTSLKLLVPAYLKRIPRDAFTARPILLLHENGACALVMAASFHSLAAGVNGPLAGSQMVVNLPRR